MVTRSDDNVGIINVTYTSSFNNRCEIEIFISSVFTAIINNLFKKIFWDLGAHFIVYKFRFLKKVLKNELVSIW